jgi:methylenetetrahydrofolate reductase (NADPH)
VEASKAEIAEVAGAYWDAGVRHIVALRGDPPTLGATFEPHPDGYASAAELVEGLRKLHPFEISVSAYPETHPEAKSRQSDIDNLKRKLDAGASRAITQFFFEPETFFRFRDSVAASGVKAEIVPGIMPVTNFASIVRMSGMTGTSVPPWLGRLFEGLDDHPAARQLVAATVSAEMCRRMYAGGVRHFHFYTLNRAELSYAICHLLGLRPSVSTVQEKAA